MCNLEYVNNALIFFKYNILGLKMGMAYLHLSTWAMIKGKKSLQWMKV